MTHKATRRDRNWIKNNASNWIPVNPPTRCRAIVDFSDIPLEKPLEDPLELERIRIRQEFAKIRYDIKVK